MNRERLQEAKVDWQEVETSEIKVGDKVYIFEADHITSSNSGHYGSDFFVCHEVTKIEPPLNTSDRFTFMTFSDGERRRFKRGNHYAIKTREGLLTPGDIKHCREVWMDLAEDEDGPEVVMTSIGYVEVWNDGEVVSFGETLTTIS